MNEKIIKLFKALADEHRQRMLELLKEEELCVSDICNNFKMQQPSVSHHLGILKRAGLIDSRKEGKEVYYSLNRYHMQDCFGNFCSHMEIIISTKPLKKGGGKKK